MQSTDCYTITPGSEPLMGPADARATVLRLTGVDPSLLLLRQWRTRGVRGVRLPFVRVGGKSYTSEAAIRWWFAASSAEATR